MPRPQGQHQRELFHERRERRGAIDDPTIVLNAAARFLEVRSRSVGEVRRHLTQAGYRAELAEAAVVRLTELGMLDDATFARMWVESRDRARPRSEAALRRELALKGIDRELAAEVLSERRSGGEDALRVSDGGGAGDGDAQRDGPDLAAAERLLRKRGRALERIADPRARRQRAYALLARNGFDPEVCREATNRLFAPGPEPAADPAAWED
jgi:regulatory protein